MGDESADSMLQEFTDTAIDFTETEEGEEDGTGEDVDETSAPIVRLVQLMIGEAVQLRASDIHVEPFEDRVRIRYRIDGVLVERDSPPRRLLGALLSRIKILAKMDIAERRRCQDGRIKITAGGKELDLRVSMLPTSHGQSCVMRLLDKDNIKVGVRQLGLSERDFKIFRNLIRRPNGIVLVTGPTGSGKTTTLYAALNELNRPDRKIITAEDPVEYYLPGINQVEVKHSIGLDFALIIRAMLRQAPNIILVGEMRDYETASMGIQASLTGHLVFSTLHTNDAPGAVTRMIDMGVPAYLVCRQRDRHFGAAVGARDLLEMQAASYAAASRSLQAAGITPEQAASANFMKGRGCNHCGKRRLPGSFGHLRADDHDLQNPRAGVPRRLDPRDSQSRHKGWHDNALRRRHPQGVGRHHDHRRGLPGRQKGRTLTRRPAPPNADSQPADYTEIWLGTATVSPGGKAVFGIRNRPKRRARNCFAARQRLARPATIDRSNLESPRSRANNPIAVQGLALGCAGHEAVRWLAFLIAIERLRTGLGGIVVCRRRLTLRQLKAAAPDGKRLPWRW